MYFNRGREQGVFFFSSFVVSLSISFPPNCFTDSFPFIYINQTWFVVGQRGPYEEDNQASGRGVVSCLKGGNPDT